jgi:hypothetical protein
MRIATSRPSMRSVRFLQGRDPGFACASSDAMSSPRDRDSRRPRRGRGRTTTTPLAWAFGGLGIADRAKHLASLYIDDIADAIRDGIAPEFELARYAERLAASAPTFDPLRDALEGEPTLIECHARRARRRAPGALPARRDRADGAVPWQPVRCTEDRARDQGDRSDDACGARRRLRQHRAARARRSARVRVRRLHHARRRRSADPRAARALRDPSKPLFARSSAKATRRARSPTARHDVPIVRVGRRRTPASARRYVSLFEMLNPMHRLWSTAGGTS